MRLLPDPMWPLRALCARGEVICLFIVGLIKIVILPWTLWAPINAFWFGKSNRITSYTHGAPVGHPGWGQTPLSSYIASLDLDESAAELATMFVPGDLQPSLLARSEAFLVRAWKAELSEHSWWPLAKEVRCLTSYLWLSQSLSPPTPSLIQPCSFRGREG